MEMHGERFNQITLASRLLTMTRVEDPKQILVEEHIKRHVEMVTTDGNILN